MKSKKLSVSTRAVVAIIAVVALQSAFYFQILPSFGNITEATSQTLLSYLLMSLTFGLLLILLERKNYVWFRGIGTILITTSIALSALTYTNDVSPMPLILIEFLSIVFTITSVIVALTLFYELFGKTDDKEIGEDNCKHNCSDWSEAGPSPLVDNDDDDNAITTGPEA